jgi:hypothetical protein
LRRSRLSLQDALAPAALAVCAWAAAIGDWLVCAVPAAVGFASVGAAYATWRRRGRPWHDWTVIALLLPAVAAGVWLTIGGTILDPDASRMHRLLWEIGPGLALTGLVCTTLGHHGKHHPDETA